MKTSQNIDRGTDKEKITSFEQLIHPQERV